MSVIGIIQSLYKKKKITEVIALIEMGLKS